MNFIIYYLQVRDVFPGYPVFKFIPDKTSPYLLSFDINLANGTLMLTFSEPVSVSSFHPTYLTLHGESNATFINGSSLFPLSSGYTNSLNGRTIILILSPSDLSNIKASIFIKSKETTYLSISNLTITDLALVPNFLVGISPLTPIQVCDFYLI